MAPGMTTMLLSFPVLMLAQKIDFENPDNVMYARLAFLTIQLLCFVTAKYLQGLVEARKDSRVIYVPPPSLSSLLGGLGGGGPATPPKTVKKTTYYALESEKIGQLSSQSLINAALMGFLSMQLNIHLPLVMQLVMSPAALLTDPIVAKYLRGIDSVGAYSETLTIPEGASLESEESGGDATAVTAGAPTPNAPAATRTKKGKSGSADVTEITPAMRASNELKKLIDVTWNGDSGTTDLSAVEALIELGADINSAVEPDGWTLLMVSSGLPANTTKTIARLLSLGADRFAVDADGWTALHWAADNNSIQAAKALLQDLDSTAQLELLSVMSKKGDAAFEVAATGKKSPECAVYLVDLFNTLTTGTSDGVAAAAASVEDEKSEEPAEQPVEPVQAASVLRQRKPMNVEDIPDID